MGDEDGESDPDSDSDQGLQTGLPGSGFTRDPPAPLTPITVEDFIHAQFWTPLLEGMGGDRQRSPDCVEG